MDSFIATMNPSMKVVGDVELYRFVLLKWYANAKKYFAAAGVTGSIPVLPFRFHYEHWLAQKENQNGKRKKKKKVKNYSVTKWQFV